MGRAVTGAPDIGAGQELRVLAAPMFDPGAARVDVTLAPGLTITQIVAATLPELPASARSRLRVALVSDRGTAIVRPEHWHRVRPRAGVQVVLRLLPGKDTLRSVLMIVVSVAAIAIGLAWGPQFAAMIGMTAPVGTALLTMGVNMIGSLLVNALVPPVKPSSQDERRARYAISGWRNRIEPDGAVPVVLGTHRYAPPFAATSWSEIVGDWQYVRAIFTFGYGPLQLSDFRLGETSLSQYDEVEIEVRDGRDGDPPVSLYPRQVMEESVGTELTRPFPRDDAGNVIAGAPAIETPIVRTTAEDSESASVIFGWPGGMLSVDDRGRKRAETVRLRIEQRLAGAANWQAVETLDITAQRAEAFYRQHSWTLPARGRWQVRVTMLTPESEDMQVQRRTVWTALQSIRPEYPLAMREPLALVGLRIKATHQLSGALEDFSALATRLCLDFDRASGTWIMRATSNPAALYRYALQGAANPRPVPDAGIDLPQLEAWHDYCREKGLRYDRVLDDAGASLRDVLTEIAAAGRAAPRHDGLRWGVTVDRPQALVVDHVSPRNSWAFKARRVYTRQPDALRVRFFDAAADYAPSERLIPRPGHAGEIVLTEALEMPGKTDAAEIWREARRRMHEVTLRPDSYEVMQEGPVRVATRGDRIALSADVLDDVQAAARVVGVHGQAIVLDEAVSVAVGEAHAIRFRSFDGAGDTVGVSQVRLVSAEPGETTMLHLDGNGAMPGAGDMVMFGRAGRETHAAIVTGVEMGDDMTCLLRAVPAAPEIDALTDAEVAPVWTPRVGSALPASDLMPPAPRFAGVSSASLPEPAIRVDLVPGTGSVQTTRYALRHRLAGASAWSTIYFSAAQRIAWLTTYITGQTVEMQAAALASTGMGGPWTAVLSHVLGSGEQPLPQALPPEVSVTPMPGAVRITFSSSADPATTHVQVYRSRFGTLDRLRDAVGEPLPMVPARPQRIELGDLTRSNLLAVPDMSGAEPWQVGEGWGISGGRAHHNGPAGALTQAATLLTGRWYRLGFRLSDVGGGSVAPYLAGSSDRMGTARTGGGFWMDRLQAVSGQTGIGWWADGSFTGSLDDVLLYEETSACLEQGTHYFWLEPRNADGLAGPVAGPFAASII